MAHKFRVVQGRPCPENIAPYIAIVLKDARATVNSIYRGDDARAILNAHGDMSQRQLFQGWVQRRPGFLPANMPGFSTHELKSDGVAYKTVPSGRDLPWWGQGFDVNDVETSRVIAAAGRHGWKIFRPYTSGAEFHHLNFAAEPRPHSLWMRLRILRLRLTLPWR